MCVCVCVCVCACIMLGCLTGKRSDVIDIDDFVFSRKRQIGNPSGYCLPKKHTKPINGTYFSRAVTIRQKEGTFVNNLFMLLAVLCINYHNQC